MKAFACLLAVALLTGCAAQATAADRISIKEVGSTLELTVPKSRLVLSVPKGTFSIATNQQGGATDNPRYFFLQDPVTGAVLSGWFEPAERFTDLEQSWKKEMEGLKANGFGDPKNVQASEIDGWKTISYDIPVGTENSSHVRATYIDAGTWIDLHASVSTKQPSDTRSRVVALMKSIHVRQKP